MKKPAFVVCLSLLLWVALASAAQKTPSPAGQASGRTEAVCTKGEEGRLTKEGVHTLSARSSKTQGAVDEPRLSKLERANTKLDVKEKAGPEATDATRNAAPVVEHRQAKEK
jgi:hypothetical protein